MSVRFNSYIGYGVKISYEKFKELGIDPYENDLDLLHNNPDSIGWDIDGMNGQYAFFGYLVHDGENNGNDKPLGGNGEAVRLELINERAQIEIQSKINEILGGEYVPQADFYVIGRYS